MPKTWKVALALGFFGAALSVACTVKEGDDDNFGGASGEGGTGGTTGGDRKSVV